MKEVMSGAYFKGEESVGFDFATDLSAADKVSFVNSVVDTVVDEDYYNSVICDMIFDFMLVKFMTNINTKDFTLNDIEQFLEETNVVDVIKANAKDGLIDELNKAVDKAIAYRTGIHTNPLGEALASLVNTLESKVNDIDLGSMMDMAKLFTGMTEDFTTENVVNAYMNSDMHKKNLEEIADSKKQREMLAEGISKVIDIAAEKTKEVKQED